MAQRMWGVAFLKAASVHIDDASAGSARLVGLVQTRYPRRTAEQVLLWSRGSVDTRDIHACAAFELSLFRAAGPMWPWPKTVGPFQELNFSSVHPVLRVSLLGEVHRRKNGGE
jgi:hypothetical protein